MNEKEIQDQITLPTRVAFQVVLQGMRIRFGRSLVTIMGVVLGIAFLMSILTSQILKQGVAEEQSTRMEVERMNNFLHADIGRPSGKELAVIQTAPLNTIEERFLRSLVAADVKTFFWYNTEASADASIPTASPVAERIRHVDLPELLDGSRYVLLLGGGPLPAPLHEIGSRTIPLNIGTTRVVADLLLPAGINITPLVQQLRPEERIKQETEKRMARFRSLWIVLISLLVTVIGITNAMLMSVTERFREIGTMKCLGALSAFIRQIFLFESCLIGAVGGVIGSLVGAFFSILIYAFTFGFTVVATALAASAASLFLYMLFSFVAGIVLSIIAALYPARIASRMVPANALRSNI
jgi:hypothetical protein